MTAEQYQDELRRLNRTYGHQRANAVAMDSGLLREAWNCAADETLRQIRDLLWRSGLDDPTVLAHDSYLDQWVKLERRLLELV